MNANKTFIIAELSANHGKDLEIAKNTIKAIKRAGADAVKLQTYTADTITINCKNDYFKIKGTHWDGKYLYDLYKEAALPWEWHAELFELAKKEDLICFSSPFDTTAVDFLEELNCPIYKIASFEITDISLIEYVAKKNKPIIISTGIANIEDVELALKTCRNVGNNDITLLKCTSEYPAKPENANLKSIPEMISRFGVKVGLSDHTTGVITPAVAVALGAEVIEKHFILDKKIGGPDAHFSLDELEFSTMVEAIRYSEKILGKEQDLFSKSNVNNKNFARSLFVVENIKKGEVITKNNVKSIRPGNGLHPKYLCDIVGKKIKRDVKMGSPMSFDLID